MFLTAQLMGLCFNYNLTYMYICFFICFTTYHIHLIGLYRSLKIRQLVTLVTEHELRAGEPLLGVEAASAAMYLYFDHVVL